ncbi:hypothetical protein LOC67_23610 [Stieleria sp. JC731]|uniref:tyrosine-type recombinase/integrase n=1 Tax=Pirellulaceae TaxID=2691357 RepID=UPI001E58A4C4|nr:site-specific integrase [Stieleria sp. JC731]MCC9603548.1 hypothetical protein [Stieleria sp. JC731]
MPKKQKPAKPYPDFPMYAHASGRWAKTIRGKTHYFGSWSDGWQAALERFQAERDDLYAGRKPRSSDGSLTVLDMCDIFINHCKGKVKTKEIVERTFRDYKKTCERIIKHFGPSRSIEDLRPADFAEFRVKLGKSRNLNSLGNEIGRVMAVINHIGPKGVMEIEQPISVGNAFKKPGRKVLRKERAEKGDQSLSAFAILETAGASKDPISAMILLGINAGLGNSDCSKLQLRHIDWREGWLDYPRPKTGIERRAKLWPETMEAIKACGGSYDGTRQTGDQLVFRTKYGNSWEGKDSACPISAEFRKILKLLGHYRHGVGFYSLRRTFQTVAEESGDFPAISLVMGHDDNSMSSRYRQRISDARLERVAETVREWLLEPLKNSKR